MSKVIVEGFESKEELVGLLPNGACSNLGSIPVAEKMERNAGYNILKPPTAPGVFSLIG
jgi:hypothetical protein